MDPLTTAETPAANGSTPAPKKTRKPRASRSVPMPPDNRSILVQWLREVGTHEDVISAFERAIGAEANRIFARRQIALRLRGGGASRLREVALDEALVLYVRDIRARVKPAEAPTLNPIYALTHPREVTAWALAMLILETVGATVRFLEVTDAMVEEL